MNIQSEPTSSRRIIVLGRRSHMQNHHRGFYEALKRRFHVRIIFVEDGWPSRAEDVPGHKDYDAWIWYVPFRELILRPGFRWSDYDGLRIMYDLDTCQNYPSLSGKSRFLGKWPEVFHRNDFQLLLCTGRLTCDRFIADGVPAYWLPKAYDPSSLFDLGSERHGICSFGASYVTRQAMLHHLRHNGVNFTTFRCRFDELNEHLNRYLGCLICNMTWRFRGFTDSFAYRVARRLSSICRVVLERGTEAMGKNLEVAGAGCAPIADWIDELEELGFEDGKNMVAYSHFEELVDKVNYYLREPEALREIGRNAMALARERHTWDHRAEQLDRLFAEYSQS